MRGLQMESRVTELEATADAQARYEEMIEREKNQELLIKVNLKLQA
jgi:hypothetical protein